MKRKNFKKAAGKKKKREIRVGCYILKVLKTQDKVIMTYNSIRPCKEVSTNHKEIFTHILFKRRPQWNWQCSKNKTKSNVNFKRAQNHMNNFNLRQGCGSWFRRLDV